MYLLLALLIALPLVQPNDNRHPGGRLADGVLSITLDAGYAGWRPDADVDSAVTVMAFAEADGVPRIPGPLLRAPQGTEIRITLRNSIPDSTLIVHGLSRDTLHVAPGATREIRFNAEAPGTHLYWASTSEKTLRDRRERDAQLTGAIVIDPVGVQPDTAERIFVITILDIFPDSAKSTSKDDIWEAAINGRSWPHTERFRYDVGDTIRWRWLNGSYRGHPMHLHGFHFRVLSKDNAQVEPYYAVTEFAMPGTSFAMEWVPTRAGNWLMHCHMATHITPFPARPAEARAHDLHDLAAHPLTGMAGLVLGIETVQGNIKASEDPTIAAQQLRLFVQPLGYVLQQGGEPARDSVNIPGSPLLLTRGVTTAITVINRLPQPTTVHWHGMELQSVYDGVAGWSGARSNLAPLLAPGDSFMVAFTPPRAGTFMYHTHMDEEDQLKHGLYGPLLVLEPGEQYDVATDLVFMLGGARINGKQRQTVNGQRELPTRTLLAGTTYRLRIINILPVVPSDIALTMDSAPLRWLPIAKDGATLPSALTQETAAQLRIGVGETYDFMWTPVRTGAALLTFLLPENFGTITQRFDIVTPD